MTRITDKVLKDNFLRDINRQKGDLESIRQQVASGLRVTKPSDDAARAGTIESYNNTLQRIDRHKQRIGYATNFLDQQENVLGQASDLLIRATELAEQGANETNGAQARAQIAVEVFELRDTLVNLANTQVQGRYIYGGFDDDDPPYDAATYVNPATGAANVRTVFDAETGTGLNRSVAISDFTSLEITSQADSVFSAAIYGLERLGRALEGYRTDPEHSSSAPTGTGAAFVLPDETAEQTLAIREALDLINDARQEDILEERVSVGGKLARIQIEEQILDTLKIDVSKSRSTIQDADIIESASILTQLETSLQGTLTSGMRISNLSLLDFL